MTPQLTVPSPNSSKPVRTDGLRAVFVHVRSAHACRRPWLQERPGPHVRVAAWPGSPAVAHDVSRFVAMEERLFVVNSGAVLRAERLPDDWELRNELLEAHRVDASGGSIIVAPDGTVIAEAEKGEETLLVADLDLARVRAARHNPDPAGHDSRPDALRLGVDRERRDPTHFTD